MRRVYSPDLTLRGARGRRSSRNPARIAAGRPFPGRAPDLRRPGPRGRPAAARPGSERYLAAAPGLPILRRRLGADARLETLAYGETTSIDGVRVSLHPAGHLKGSAQVRLEHRGQVWVVSGDYKTEPDGLSEPFDPHLGPFDGPVH